MDKDLDRRFERLEKALADMIDSLAKNHPSEKLAEELVAAEDDLKKGLKILETHQNNYARILRLREEVARYDAQIKDVISSLWNMRKELVAVPTTSPKDPKYKFTTDELLTYARLISRNTLPLPGVANNILPPSQPSTQQQQPALEPDDSFRHTPTTSFNMNASFATTTGGATTPGGPLSASTPNTTTQPDLSITQQTSQLPPSQPDLTTLLPSTKPPTTEQKLPPHLHPAINPLHDATFQPWPTQDQIRSGGLAAIQRLVDRGIDPRGYDPEEEERKRVAAEQAKRAAEEEARLEVERQAREERDRIVREREERARRAREAALAAEAAGTSGGGGAERRESVVAVGRSGGAPPKQFTFLGADDDDDEDEED